MQDYAQTIKTQIDNYRGKPGFDDFIKEAKIETAKEIKKDYEFILEKSPVFYKWPFQPLDGKKQDVLDLLVEAVAILEQEKSINYVMLYEKVNEGKNNRLAEPELVMIIIARHRGAMKKAANSPNLSQIEKQISALCSEKKKMDDGQSVVNGTLLGLI